MNVMRIKNGNRILCAATVGMVGIQFALVFIGVNHTLIHILASQFSIILICLLGIWISDVDFKETFRVRLINGKTCVFAFLAVLCSFPIISLLNMLSMLFVENAVVGTASDIYPYGLTVSLLVMAVLPAIGEELLVRGVIYRSYRQKSPILAWILSSIIFGMLHMNFNQMPYAIYLGILMVVMVEASDSILTSMCMHFFVNGISTLSGYFSATEVQMETEILYSSNMLLNGDSMMKLFWISLVTVACLMIPLILLVVIATFRVNHRSFKQAFQKKEPLYEPLNLPEVKEEEKIVDVWFILAIFVMVILTILSTWM